MSIIKTLTSTLGIIYEYHKIMYIVIDAQDNVVASVASWINKDRFTEEDTPVDRFSFRINAPIAAGMLASAEVLLVSEPDSPLYGGLVTQDIVVSDLNKAKAGKKAEITSARTVEMYADKTTTLGVFGSTESDNNKLSIAIQVTQLAAARGASAECGYSDVNGVWSVYSLADLEQIALEIAAQVIPLYAKEAQLVAQVDGATTAEEVVAVVW